MRKAPPVSLAVAALILLGCAATDMMEEPSEQAAISTKTSADTFDIRRFQTAGYNMFTTFHVTETRHLHEVRDAGEVSDDTMLLVTETAAGNLALLTSQMAAHHIAQGTADGKDWMATF